MTRRRRIAVGVGLASIALLLVLLRWLDQHPLDVSRFRGPDEVAAPGLPPRGTAGGALAVVSPDAIRSAAGLDASFAWLDVLENEYGATRWIRPDEIASDSERASVAVVTTSAAPVVNDAMLGLLAARSLVVVVDDPSSAASVRRIGDTPVIPVDDLARRIARRRQGVLGKDQRLAKRFGRYAQVIEPEDLVADEASLTSEIPDADRLVAELASRVDALVPIPRLWPHPAGYEGTFLLTHDEDEQGGDATLDLLRREAAWGARSTVFIVPSGRLWETWTDAQLEEALGLGADLQLHWNRFSMPAGIWKIEPLKTVYGLSTQRESLVKRGLDATVNRTHYLHLGSDLAAYFGMLDAAGVRADCTFGPNRAGRGHLFGTARPFRALDGSGMPSPVIEIPFQTQEDWGGVDEPFLERLFRESALRDHGILGAIVHPHLIVRTDAGARLHRRLVELSKETRHWIATVSDALEFRRSRLVTPVRLTRGTERDTIVAEVETTRDDFALRVPDGTCELDGRPVVSGESGPRDTIAIPAGRHRVVVRARP